MNGHQTRPALIELTEDEDQLLIEAGFESYYDWSRMEREALTALIRGRVSHKEGDK